MNSWIEWIVFFTCCQDRPFFLVSFICRSFPELDVRLWKFRISSDWWLSIQWVRWKIKSNDFQFKVLLEKRKRGANSVTRLLDYLFNIWTFKTMEQCQKHLKFTKVRSKLCQILNDPFLSGDSLFTSCLSGKISPNLVTLVVRAVCT